MQVEGDYWQKGYAGIKGLLPDEVVTAFLGRLQADLANAGIPLQTYAKDSAVVGPQSINIYGYNYKPMITFLWGLTPTMAALTGRELLPTYNHFRLYRQGEICKVHSDRPECEHSLSLTLGYSDGEPWELQFGSERIAEPQPMTADFGDDAYNSVAMQPGDAVLYQGVHYRHGRVRPNPNRWSAHMFLHWVDRAGPFADRAFDGQGNIPPRPDFNLG